jgi:hypothetical protein
MSALLRSFYALTYASMGLSTLVFILSMLDLGFESFWTNPVISGLTCIHHAVILVLQTLDRRSKALNDDTLSKGHVYPTSSIAGLVFAYLLAGTWTIPISFTAVVGGLKNINSTYESDDLLAGNVGTVRAQLALDVVEFVVMLAIAAVSTRMRVVAVRWAKGHSRCVTSEPDFASLPILGFLRSNDTILAHVAASNKRAPAVNAVEQLHD